MIEIMSTELAESRCHLRQGPKTCAYLGLGNPSGGPGEGGWTCMKGISNAKYVIDERLKEGTMGAQGDYCSGPPDYEVKQ